MCFARKKTDLLMGLKSTIKLERTMPGESVSLVKLRAKAGPLAFFCLISELYRISIFLAESVTSPVQASGRRQSLQAQATGRLEATF